MSSSFRIRKCTVWLLNRNVHPLPSRDGISVNMFVCWHLMKSIFLVVYRCVRCHCIDWLVLTSVFFSFWICLILLSIVSFVSACSWRVCLFVLLCKCCKCNVYCSFIVGNVLSFCLLSVCWRFMSLFVVSCWKCFVCFPYCGDLCLCSLFLVYSRFNVYCLFNCFFLFLDGDGGDSGGNERVWRTSRSL